MKTDDGKPLQLGDPCLVVAYAAAHAEQETFFSLSEASTEFTGKADRTKKDYLKRLKVIEARFGTMPLDIVQDVRARGKFKAWRDELAIKSLRQPIMRGWCSLAFSPWPRTAT